MSNPQEPKAKRVFTWLAGAFLLLYLAVICLAAVATWTYQTEWAGKLDGLETLYLFILGLPWTLLPIPSPWPSDHGDTIFLTLLCLLNWVIVVVLIRKFLRFGRTRGSLGQRLNGS